MADDQQVNARTNCLPFFISNQCQHEPNASVWIPPAFKCSSSPHPWECTADLKDVTPHTSEWKHCLSEKKKSYAELSNQ